MFIGNNIIAKIFSMNIAGLYVQAVRLQNYPLSMVSNVVDKTFFPIFSKMNDDWRLLKEQICKLRRLLYAVLFPLFSVAICFAKPIVSIVLGEKWLGSVSYFQILMLASFPLLVKALNRNVLKSFGFTAVIFRIEVYSAVLLLFCLFIAFLFKSILVVLLAVVLGQSFSALFSMFYLKKKCAMELRKQLFDILVFFPCAIIPALLQYIVSDNVWIQMSTYIASFLAMIVFYSFRGCEEYLRFYRMGKR
ncbi:oligosaccharide flippase family protein [Parabacteroides distasonis]|uniref:oligosaccharide flippase family protein n=1 Tax=Parabacteroides distasonis TaxID=823 RepID=UPI00374E1796